MTLSTPPAPDPASNCRSRTRRFWATICAIIAIALLAGCASETAKDQSRGQQRDATRTAVIARIQETIAAKPFAATPKPEPTPTPYPIVSTLTLSLGINSGNSPQQQVQSFSAGTNSVYVAAQIANLRKGEVVKASWRTPNDAEVASSQTTVTADADQQWVAFPLQTRLQPGEYAVYILVNNTILNSLVFTVN